MDHIVPVDIYLPGCPPPPEMLIDAIVKLHDRIQNMKLGVDREREVAELEEANLRCSALGGRGLQPGAISGHDYGRQRPRHPDRSLG